MLNTLLYEIMLAAWVFAWFATWLAFLPAKPLP